MESPQRQFETQYPSIGHITRGSDGRICNGVDHHSPETYQTNIPDGYTQRCHQEDESGSEHSRTQHACIYEEHT
eukprot:5709374-Pyramimonas_sp.AAC.1